MPPMKSTMPPLGTACPDFAVPDFGVGGHDGRVIRTRADLTGGPAAVVAFICNHCPFVVHIQGQLAALGRDLAIQGVPFIAISANNVQTHPDDAPERMTISARDNAYTFPYCYDEAQAVAKAFRAACTPDFFVFDAELRLTYRGQLDDSRPGNGLPVTGKDLREAVAKTIAGEVIVDQKPSIGCGIKWKPGNAPEVA